MYRVLLLSSSNLAVILTPADVGLQFKCYKYKPFQAVLWIRIRKDRKLCRIRNSRIWIRIQNWT
jgi:hypothetical protein